MVGLVLVTEKRPGLNCIKQENLDVKIPIKLTGTKEFRRLIPINMTGNLTPVFSEFQPTCPRTYLCLAAFVVC